MRRTHDRQLDAKDLLGLLRRHLIPDETRPAGIFASEIQAPGPSQRRADLIWLGCTAASGGELVGYEIKTNRADLVAELADLTKSHPWQRYCDRWNLVLSDLALADGLELPPTWGVLTPPSGRRTRTMTVVAKAPKLDAVDRAPALATIATRMHWHAHRQDARLKAMQQEIDRLTAERDDLNLLVPHGTATGRREQKIVARIVRALGVTPDGALGSWRDTIDVEQAIAVLKDVAAARGLAALARDQAESFREQLTWMNRQIKRTLDETAAPRAGNV